MKMSEEDCLDVLGLDAGLQHRLHVSDAAVNQLWTAIHERSRRKDGPPGSAEKKEFQYG